MRFANSVDGGSSSITFMYLFAQGTNTLFAQTPKRTHIILSPTAVHGNIFRSIISLTSRIGGLAKAATIIEKADVEKKKRFPNILLWIREMSFRELRLFTITIERYRCSYQPCALP